VTRTQILDHVWGYSFSRLNLVDVYVTYLRRNQTVVRARSIDPHGSRRRLRDWGLMPFHSALAPYRLVRPALAIFCTGAATYAITSAVVYEQVDRELRWPSRVRATGRRPQVSGRESRPRGDDARGPQPPAATFMRWYPQPERYSAERQTLTRRR
jgi:hypothetical protein